MSTTTKERPVIFSGPMIRAILAGRKTMTRRVFKPSKASKMSLLPDDFWQIDPDEPGTAYLNDFSGRLEVKCPYGQPGDRLWVRETWALVQGYEDPDTRSIDTWTEWDTPMPKERPGGGWSVARRADGWEEHVDDRGFNWRPSIFMPRWASRIILEITEVRVERLHDISEADAKAEGADLKIRHGDDHWSGWGGGGSVSEPIPNGYNYRDGFRYVWEIINDKRPGCTWAGSPWVWVVSFRRLGVAE